LPDISKINALTIGSALNVDGLAKVSIINIDGVTVPAVAAAYSVRLLGSGVYVSPYTGVAMRIRRDTAGGTGDNDEADVAFDTSLTDPTVSLDSAVSNFSGTSNATNLGQFLNATGYTDADSLGVVADGFCDEWKDQSGNGNHAEQTTYTNQPQIFDSASATDLITINGKPALYTPNADQDLQCSGTDVLSQVYTVNAVGKGGHPYADDGGASRIFLTSSSVRFKAGTEISLTGINANGNQTTVFCVADSTSSSIYAKNSAAQVNTTGDAGTRDINFDVGFQIGNRASFANGGYTQEIIFWVGNQSTNRTALETDVNDFFGIY
jgi:hypothetical protein